MKNMKYLIILLAIILIFLLVILVAILHKKEETTTQIEPLNRIEVEAPKESVIRLERVSSPANFWQVDNFINNFFDYILERNKNEPNNEAACDVLDEAYKSENNITTENVLEFFSQYTKNMVSYTTTNMYEEQYLHSEENINNDIYIEGKIRNEETSQDIYILVKEDLSNYTYSIQFMNKEKFEELTKQTSITPTIIQPKLYNKIDIITVSDYEICLEHFRNYLNILRNNKEEAYELLDKNYREKRFGKYEYFKQYIEENIDYVNRTGFTQYGVNTTKEGEKQYICKDNYGYTYVFTEEYPMKYKLQLDTYTIETDEFIQQYNQVEEDKKAQINIQKFIMMINNQDYTNAYAKIDTTYKQTYFSTQTAFEEYIKENMFKYNNIAIQKNEKIGDTYICTVKLTDLTNGIYKDETKKDIENYTYNVVIKLLKGTDFVMSFNKE